MPRQKGPGLFHQTREVPIFIRLLNISFENGPSILYILSLEKFILSINPPV
jgi:hypothetical protein